MSSFLNAAPQFKLEGIKDSSARRVDPERETLPIHTPHLMFLAQRGPAKALFLKPTDATNIYGAESFNYRGEYATHATPLMVEAIAANANESVYQRLIPAGAKKSRVSIYLDLLKTKLPVYQRDANGDLVLDAGGNPIDTGSTVDGYVGKFVLDTAPAHEVGAAKSKVGTQTDATSGTQSMLYPFFDGEVNDFGKFGDNVGFRMWAPTTKSSIPQDERLVNAINAFVYRLQLVERPTARSTANVTQTIYDAQYIDFSLKPDSYDDKTGTEYYIGESYEANYRDDDPTTGYAPVFAPFGKMHFYTDFIKEVSALVYAEEMKQNVDLVAGGELLINLLSGVDIDNRPYHAYAVKDVLSGGLSFTENSTFYAGGGKDGEMSNAIYNELARNEFANYGELDNKFQDIAAFPQSIIYDTGFDIETKKALIATTSIRKDLLVIVSTQDVALPVNDAVKESAMAIMLRTAAELSPESTLYGTHVTRVAIVGHAGKLINSSWKKLVPMTVEIAAMLSKYAGAGDGILKGAYAPDVDPNNHVTMLRDLNCTFKGATVRNKDWDNGLIWAQSYSTRSFFIPAMQTVFDDDTSVLNSLLNVLIAVECQKVCFRTWRSLVGRTDLTKEQYIKRSNQLITENTAGRFDNRVQIVPDTYYTKQDEQRGYSNHATIHMYANNMPTSTSFTVEAHRMEDLNNG